MINIDLLPPEDRPAKLISPLNIIIMLLAAAALLSVIIPSIMLVAAVQDYAGRVAYQEQEIRLYAQQVKDMQELAKKIKLLKARLSLVKELLEERTTWSDKLAELCENLPQNGIWIDGLTFEREEITKKAPAKTAAGKAVPPKKSIRTTAYVSGTVVSVDKMSEFVANLENSRMFKNVVFDSAATTGGQSGGNAPIAFDLSLGVVIAPEAQ